jgi:hypothetical protein
MRESGAPAPAARLRYGEGVFRRAFLLVADEGCVVAEREDDFHRFRVTRELDACGVTRDFTHRPEALLADVTCGRAPGGSR